jgi:hypothetical protein
MPSAILDDRKTQTRRPLKPHLQHVEAWRTDGHGRFYGVSRLATTGGLGVPETDFIESPLGKPGDRLWVRETIKRHEHVDGPWHLLPEDRIDSAYYAADHEVTSLDYWPWKRPVLPAIHCPRGLSRLFLDVLDVRIERLQDISEEDARAEGVEQCGGFMTPSGCWMNYGKSGPSCKTARESFQTLWISVYGAESWAANPWVWVTEFKRVTQTL